MAIGPGSGATRRWGVNEQKSTSAGGAAVGTVVEVNPTTTAAQLAGLAPTPEAFTALVHLSGRQVLGDRRRRHALTPEAAAALWDRGRAEVSTAVFAATHCDDSELLGAMATRDSRATVRHALRSNASLPLVPWLGLLARPPLGGGERDQIAQRIHAADYDEVLAGLEGLDPACAALARAMLPTHPQLDPARAAKLAEEDPSAVATALARAACPIPPAERAVLAEALLEASTDASLWGRSANLVLLVAPTALARLVERWENSTDTGWERKGFIAAIAGRADLPAELARHLSRLLWAWAALESPPPNPGMDSLLWSLAANAGVDLELRAALPVNVWAVAELLTAAGAGAQVWVLAAQLLEGWAGDSASLVWSAATAAEEPGG